jgi:hypothetical protein
MFNSLSSFSLSVIFITKPSRISGSYELSSLGLLGYSKALKQACPLHWPQAKEHSSPDFLHPQREPQPFLQLQNIIFSISAGAGDNNVLMGSRISFSSFQPHS